MANESPPAKITPGARVGRIGGRAVGATNHITRRFNQSLAVVARASVPAEIMMEYLLAILAGHGQAAIEQDDDGEWCVTWPEPEMLASTPEQRQWAWVQWRQAAYGMPAQHIQLEHDLRAQMSSLTMTADTRQLGPLQAAALHQAVRAVFGQPGASSPALPASADHPATPAVIDAHSTPVAGSSEALALASAPQGADSES